MDKEYLSHSRYCAFAKMVGIFLIILTLLFTREIEVNSLLKCEATSGTEKVKDAVGTEEGVPFSFVLLYRETENTTLNRSDLFLVTL